MVWFVRVIQKAVGMHVKAIQVNTKEKRRLNACVYISQLSSGISFRFVVSPSFSLSLCLFLCLYFHFLLCVCDRWSVVVSRFRRSRTLFCRGHRQLGSKMRAPSITRRICKCSKIYAMDITEYAKLFKCTRRTSKSFEYKSK